MTVFSREQLDALGVATDLKTAGAALGVSKAHAYRMAEAGEFPVRVIRVGGRWTVPTAGLREFLLGESAPPADQVLARLDRMNALLEELVRQGRMQSAALAGVPVALADPSRAVG